MGVLVGTGVAVGARVGLGGSVAEGIGEGVFVGVGECIGVSVLIGPGVDDASVPSSIGVRLAVGEEVALGSEMGGGAEGVKVADGPVGPCPWEFCVGVGSLLANEPPPAFAGPGVGVGLGRRDANRRTFRTESARLGCVGVGFMPGMSWSVAWTAEATASGSKALPIKEALSA